MAVVLCSNNKVTYSKCNVVTLFLDFKCFLSSSLLVFFSLKHLHIPNVRDENKHHWDIYHNCIPYVSQQHYSRNAYSICSWEINMISKEKKKITGNILSITASMLCRLFKSLYQSCNRHCTFYCLVNAGSDILSIDFQPWRDELIFSPHCRIAM